MQYEPKPLKTNDIQLPEDILMLQEQLAKNIHEVWAKQRIEQGWTYGPVRDDEKKTHPNLKPYEQLTDEEKDYDRNTVLETLKTITLLGYTIQKNNKTD